MNNINTEIEGVQIIIPKKHMDNRGWFSEIVSGDIVNEFFPDGIRQVSRSFSHVNVVRGLHFQCMPLMGKLIRCIYGEIILYNVDMREGSPTFLASVEVVLSPHNNKMVWAPGWCARGFYANTDSIVEYFHDHTRNDTTAVTLAWNDPELGIAWPTTDPVLSEKDQHGLTVQEWLQTRYSKLLPFAETLSEKIDKLKRNGTGKNKCPQCDGSGSHENGQQGSGVTCGICNGTGRI